MQLWQKRIIRLWLVIILPVGIFLCCQAYSLMQTSMKMQDSGESYLYSPYDEGTDSDTISALSQDPEYPKVAKGYFHLRDKYESQSNVCAIIAGIFLLFPAIIWTLAKIYRFVMYGQEEANKSFIKWFKYAFCLALIVFAIVALYPFVVKKKEEAPVPANVKVNDSTIFNEYSSQLHNDSKLYDEMQERKKTPPQ